MKKLLQTLGLSVSIVVLMGACATGGFYSYEENSVRYLSLDMRGFITPLTADLQVSSDKITYTETFPNTFTYSDINNINNSGTVMYFKNHTMAEAVKMHNADVIVAPIFDIKTSDDFSTITVTVIGYPANYINFRKATPEDINLIYLFQTESKSDALGIATKTQQKNVPIGSVGSNPSGRGLFPQPKSN